jgi:hypothetical protein
MFMTYKKHKLCTGVQAPGVDTMSIIYVLTISIEIVHVI